MQSSDNMLRLCVVFLGLFAVLPSWGIELRGVASVNVTSDTAVNAKNMAFDEARRQIITDSLRQYADVDSLKTAVQNAKDVDLMNLVAASSIDGEKQSDTTYSANITMMIDTDAARVWLGDNGVQNWLPDNQKRDVFVVQVNMSKPIENWADLNRIARNEKIDLGTKTIFDGVVTLELPVSVRGEFTIAVRESGWRYANNDGVLRIWK